MKNIGCSLNTILIYLKSIMVQVIIFFVFCMCLLVSEWFFWCTEKKHFFQVLVLLKLITAFLRPYRIVAKSRSRLLFPDKTVKAIRVATRFEHGNGKIQPTFGLNMDILNNNHVILVQIRRIFQKIRRIYQLKTIGNFFMSSITLWTRSMNLRILRKKSKAKFVKKGR